MPRRRRNQKLRKINDKNGRNICIRAPGECVDADPLIDNTARTCVENDSLNRTTISAISGVIIRTPTPDMVIHENELISPLKTTPLNSRIRATSIEQYSKKFNVTNLNIIFNGSLNNSVDYHSVTSFRGDELTTSHKRSLSNSPILTAISNQTELLKKCKATQTSEKSMDGASVSSRTKEPIIETPKIRRYSSLKISSQEIPRIDEKGLESENNLNQEFNINPYLNKQMKIGFRESIDEISLYTPELFKNKAASTPVDIVNTKKISNSGNYATQQKTTEYGANPSFLCSSSTPKVDNKTVPPVGKHHFREKHLSRSLPYTKRYSTNDSLDSFNKYLDAFSSSRALISKSLTPKRTVLCTRCYSRKYLTTRHLNYCCRTFEYKQVFQGHINDTLCSQNFGLFERIINRLKRYSRISARWSMRLVEMCAIFGIAIKTSLTNLCKLYGPSNMVAKEAELKPCDHCSSYRKEIDALNTKIEHLYSTLDGVKSMLDENKRDNERKAEELKVLSCEVEQFKSFKQEWETWKNKHTLSNYVPLVAPLRPPPPPPPLPPPLPFTPGASQSMGSIQSTNKNKKLKRAETARPIISLDDILKVKLKKAGERPNPLRRASNPPVVSIETLKQVKLRPSLRQATPSVRQATPSSFPDTSSGSSTSPHSALKRLLSETTVGKVKRLRRVGGYSFDDICRRNLTAKYSRERTYD